MWTGPSGQLVLVFVPSISAVPVQRNGARRGSQCFSYGRVQNSNFKSLRLIWGASGTPSPMVIQTRLNILRNTHQKHFRNFDFDQWGMLKKREKTTFLNFDRVGKIQFGRDSAADFIPGSQDLDLNGLHLNFFEKIQNGRSGIFGKNFDFSNAI
jgi:hypothetical protein